MLTLLGSGFLQPWEVSGGTLMELWEAQGGLLQDRWGLADTSWAMLCPN